MDASQASWFAIHWKAVTGVVLGFFPVAWFVRWAMRKTHQVSKLSGRIVVPIYGLGSIYINNQTKSICVLGIGIKHFWYFPIEFEPILFEPCFSGYTPFCQITAEINPLKLRSGENGQILIPSYQLGDDRIAWMNEKFRNPEWIDVYFTGSLKFKTWFGSFAYSISTQVRCNVLRG